MVSTTVIVENRAGIHARPAALITQTANTFASNITIKKDNLMLNAKSIMGVMTMAAGYKTELVLSADGVDEEQALAALTQLFANKFEED